MQDENYLWRFRQLYRMLFELSTGNLAFRMQDEGVDDLGKLSDSLNTFAAQMQLALLKANTVKPYYSYQNLVYAAFLLNRKFAVVACSHNALTLLDSDFHSIANKPFAYFLTAKGRLAWQSFEENAHQIESFQENLQLEFLIDQSKIVPAFCSVSSLAGLDCYLVSTVNTLLREIGEITPIPDASSADFSLAQGLYEFILTNLDKPLPTLAKLASHFGTNQSRLKEIFRTFFNTSIYHFYNEERLKRAHLIIEQTNLTLKAVAIMAGFNDYITFSKAFRKKFGYAPSFVKRINTSR